MWYVEDYHTGELLYKNQNENQCFSWIAANQYEIVKQDFVIHTIYVR